MEWILLGIALVLIAANAVFVAAEFSMITVERSEVEARAAEADRAAQGILPGLKTLSTQLSGAQLGITVTSLVVGVLAQPSLATLLRGPLLSLGVPEGAIDTVALLCALALATGFQMIFAELVPKNLAIARPFAVAAVTVPMQRAFTAATGPLIRFLNGNANAILRKMGIEPKEELASARSAMELRSLVEHSMEVGTLDGPTAVLLTKSLRFGDQTAADAMTPRPKVKFVPAGMSVSEFLALVRETGHSRFPVVGRAGSDDVLGIVGLRNALAVAEADRSSTHVADVMAPTSVVPETLPLDDLLPVLRESGQLAVVVDEYGGTAGVITLEDLVEELVGEVSDEHDVPQSRYTRGVGGSIRLSGLLRTDELRDLGLPTDDDPGYDTLGGLLHNRLGRLAEVNDVIEIPGWRLQVMVMDGRRVDVVLATPEKLPLDDE